MTAISYGRTNAEITRRGLLAAGGAAVVGLALAEGSRLADLAGGFTSPAVPAYLRRSTFSPLVGERFVLSAAGRRAVVSLVAVDDLAAGGRTASVAGRDDAFALIFHAPAGARIDQDVMTVSHPGIGRFPLLVSPSGTGHHGQDYAAIINRAGPPPHTRRTRARALPGEIRN
ncbi:MAG TPA: hypothetical protein VG165_12005 [Solirubrobacteraceae bacterium]|nr:hypothetical protein [Solirubrobacteraceae bacterium]